MRWKVQLDKDSLKNAFWSIANSSPYSASSYDTLHSDELGKWGKHLWSLAVDVLGELKKKGQYSNKYVICFNFLEIKLFTHFIQYEPSTSVA
jgi:hypothetical protein